MMENIKEIPYGIANFVEVAEQNMYYVDKTMYLPLLEKQPRNLFFIRPRCFGKSIFLSMLRAYYDIAQKEKVSIRPRACFSPSYNKVKSQTKHVWLLTLL